MEQWNVITINPECGSTFGSKIRGLVITVGCAALGILKRIECVERMDFVRSGIDVFQLCHSSIHMRIDDTKHL